jgi:hypothetical protein
VLRSAGFSIDRVLKIATLDDSRALDEAILEARKALREAAKDPSFVEAITWQNPKAVETALASLSRKSIEEASSKTRRHESLVASYLQRYTTKNDTAGFFGPYAWGRLDPAQTKPAAAHGPRLTARDRAELEHWAVIALAEALSKDPELRATIPPRRLPLDAAVEDPTARALLEAIDGVATPAEVAARAGLEEDLIFALLDRLHEAGLIDWSLPAPFHPDLRGLDRLPERAEIKAVEAKRAAVEAARGDPRKLANALGDLERTFESITATGAHRREGETYAARGLVFLSSTRDVDPALDPHTLADLDRALEPVLLSARATSAKIAAEYRAAFRALFESTGEIELPKFLQRASHLLPGTGRPDLIDRAIAATQATWAELYELPARAAERRLSLEAEDLPRERFAAADCGFPHAQVHSPDLMIADKNGELELIVGELHLATDSMNNPAFLAGHPDPAKVSRAIEALYPRPLIEWVLPRGRETYVAQLTSDPEGLSIELDRAQSWRRRERTFRADELYLVDRAGDVRVRDQSGALDVELVDFASFEISAYAGGAFRLFPPLPHRPRILLDRLVLAREEWRIPASEAGAALAHDPAERIQGFRALAARLGLPRWLFVRVEEETKPLFLDLASPPLLELAARAMRNTRGPISFTEMLPSPEELWLADREGRRYTSELRLLVADPIPYRWR